MKRMGFGMGNFSMFGSSSVNYYCMSCGTKHNDAACPRCGSKMKRVGWLKLPSKFFLNDDFGLCLSPANL